MYNLWLSRGYLSQTQYFGLQHPAPAHSKVGTHISFGRQCVRNVLAEMFNTIML